MLEKALLVLGEVAAEFPLLTDLVEVSLKPLTFLYKGVRKNKYFPKIFFGDLTQLPRKGSLSFRFLGGPLFGEYELTEKGVLRAV